MYKDMRSWRRVGNALGVNPGVAWKYAKTDYEPKGDALRKALGFDPFPEIDYIRQKRGENGRFE